MAEFKDSSQSHSGSKQSDIPVTVKSWLSSGCSELCRLPPPPPPRLLLYRFAAQAWTLCHPADLNGTMGGTAISSYLSSRRRVFWQPAFVFRQHMWMWVLMMRLMSTTCPLCVFMSTSPKCQHMLIALYIGGFEAGIYTSITFSTTKSCLYHIMID